MPTQLTSQQRANIDIIIKAAKDAGINNNLVIASILSIVGKESNYIPTPEKSYRNTSNDRIRSVFSKTRSLTDAQLTELKKDDVKFFNFVYGGLFGNNTQNDGYRYRGRGFNQITFKNNYILASKDVGRSIVLNPELLDNPDIAAKALIGYYLRNYGSAVRSGIYPINQDINSVQRSDTAYNVIYNINRGKHALPVKDTTGGYNKGKELFTGVLDYVKKKISTDKTRIYPFVLIGLGVAGIAWFLTRKK